MTDDSQDQAEKTPSIKIEIVSKDHWFEYEGQKYLMTPMEQLQNLLSQNKEYKADLTQLKKCVLDVLALLGLLDVETQTVKESIKSGEESYFKHIVKALKDVIVLVSAAQFMPSKNAELEIKFAFIKDMLPIIEKYANGK